MKLSKGMLIAFNPDTCGTIPDRSNSETFAVGVVHSYDRWSNSYEIDIGFDHIYATIFAEDVTRNTVRVIGLVELGY